MKGQDLRAQVPAIGMVSLGLALYVQVVLYLYHYIVFFPHCDTQFTLTVIKVVVALGITWAVCSSRIKARREKFKLSRNPNELDIAALNPPIAEQV